jgi:hypothetical protein
MKKLKLSAFVFAGIAFVMVSCSKGTTGPAGATGATGPAGPDSVYHSAWTQLSMTQQIDASNDTFYVQDIAASAVTQVVLDSSLVLGYISFIDNTGATNIFNASELLEITYSIGNVDLIAPIDDSYTNTGYSFRYVIIPGTVLVTNSILKNLTKAQIKASSYSVISSALGISDKTTPN